MYTDPTGHNFVLSVDLNGAGGNGHTSLYFQDGNGNWNKFDQGAAGMPSSGGASLGFLSGSNAPAGVSIKSLDAPPEGSKEMTTTKEQDIMIADEASKSQKAHNSGDIDYNLYSNNCTDAAVGVVNNSGAKIKVPNSPFTVRPNSWKEKYDEWASENSDQTPSQDKDSSISTSGEEKVD